MAKRKTTDEEFLRSARRFSRLIDASDYTEAVPPSFFQHAEIPDLPEPLHTSFELGHVMMQRPPRRLRELFGAFVDGILLSVLVFFCIIFLIALAWTVVHPLPLR